jgi:hypothetical protein
MFKYFPSHTVWISNTLPMPWYVPLKGVTLLKMMTKRFSFAASVEACCGGR